MKKEERQTNILNMINQAGQVTVNEIMDALSVSDMTVRRDLNDLSQRGLLVRTHGGAQRIVTAEGGYERSHIEKKSLHEEEKRQIAAKAAELVNDGETIFLGPGTTLEQIAYSLRNKSIRVVTNSLPVFQILNHSSSADLLLTGGEYRNITGAFVGSIAIRAVENMRFSKAFISSNGVAQNAVFTYSEAEGEIQKAALNSAAQKYLVADSSKFGNFDFYEFYKTSDFDCIITDSKIDDETLRELKEYSEVYIA